MPDISNMKISDLLRLAEERAALEKENPPEQDPDHDTSWAATLVMLQYIREHGVPEGLRDTDERLSEAQDAE